MSDLPARPGIGVTREALKFLAAIDRLTSHRITSPCDVDQKLVHLLIREFLDAFLEPARLFEGRNQSRLVAARGADLAHAELGKIGRKGRRALAQGRRQKGRCSTQLKNTCQHNRGRAMLVGIANPMPA